MRSHWFIRCSENIWLARVKLTANSFDNPIALGSNHGSFERADKHFTVDYSRANVKLSTYVEILNLFEIGSSPAHRFNHYWLLAKLCHLHPSDYRPEPRC